jgi:hypothetical protein
MKTIFVKVAESLASESLDRDNTHESKQSSSDVRTHIEHNYEIIAMGNNPTTFFLLAPNGITSLWHEDIIINRR